MIWGVLFKEAQADGHEEGEDHADSSEQGSAFADGVPSGANREFSCSQEFSSSCPVLAPAAGPEEELCLHRPVSLLVTPNMRYYPKDTRRSHQG